MCVCSGLERGPAAVVGGQLSIHAPSVRLGPTMKQAFVLRTAVLATFDLLTPRMSARQG